MITFVTFFNGESLEYFRLYLHFVVIFFVTSSYLDNGGISAVKQLTHLTLVCLECGELKTEKSEKKKQKKSLNGLVNA